MDIFYIFFSFFLFCYWIYYLDAPNHWARVLTLPDTKNRWLRYNLVWLDNIYIYIYNFFYVSNTGDLLFSPIIGNMIKINHTGCDIHAWFFYGDNEHFLEFYTIKNLPCFGHISKYIKKILTYWKEK